MLAKFLSLCLGLLVVMLAACTAPYPESCPSYSPFNLSRAGTYPNDNSLPFQFPLEDFDPRTPTRESSFVAYGKAKPDSPTEYHAAEDSFKPAGSPVYAMADGRISYSAPAGGYGWLIIIDHPQANLYSLYGHLSPSRWKLESGTEVKKGDLIAYLGDPNENGGSDESPLEPHLHLGIRTGQTNEYPAKGEWRYMAGWIKLCPQDLGWLQPSLVITSQTAPVGGYPEPEVGFLIRWGSELLITSIYTIAGVCILVFAFRKRSRFFLLLPGVFMIIAGIIFHSNGMISTYILLVIGVIMIALGILLYILLSKKPERSSPS